MHISPLNLPLDALLQPNTIQESVAPFLSRDPFEEMAVLAEALALSNSAQVQPSTSRFLSLSHQLSLKNSTRFCRKMLPSCAPHSECSLADRCNVLLRVFQAPCKTSNTGQDSIFQAYEFSQPDC